MCIWLVVGRHTKSVQNNEGKAATTTKFEISFNHFFNRWLSRQENNITLELLSFCKNFIIMSLFKNSRVGNSSTQFNVSYQMANENIFSFTWKHEKKLPKRRHQQQVYCFSDFIVYFPSFCLGVYFYARRIHIFIFGLLWIQTRSVFIFIRINPK